jgi:hypothetical protein
MRRVLEVGSPILFVDKNRRHLQAIVTEIHGQTEYDEDNPPALNLVYVSPESNEVDCFGRQIRRESSVVHKSRQSANGNYWM